MIPDNYVSSSANVPAPTPNLGGVTFHSPVNVATSDYHNAVPHLNYHTFQNVVNGGLIGGTSMFHSKNDTVHSGGTSSIHDQLIYEQPLNGGLEGNNNIMSGGNNFSNADLRVIYTSPFFISTYYLCY